MQDLDTYGCIRRYAKDPYAVENVLAFRLLKRRTEVHSIWSFIQHNAGLNVEKAMKISVGALLDKKTSLVPVQDSEDFQEHFMDMSEKERLDLYKEVCKKAGIEVNYKELGLE